MRVAVVINPVSGPRARADTGAARRAEAARALARLGVEHSLALTEYPGHARQLAAEAVSAGVERVIAWGGDGTINEVASALAWSGIALGIVRSGSGNGLANELGVPHRPVEAFARALACRPRAIDLGEINGRLFVNVAGIGFDARIAHRFNALRGRSHGLRTYVREVVDELRAYAPSRFTLATDDQRVEIDALIVVFANAPQYGNRARICPTARLDDGKLDAVAVRSRGALRDLWRARRLFTGSVLRDPGVWHRQIDHAVVGTAAATPYHVDGEPCDAASTFVVRVRPLALRVCA